MLVISQRLITSRTAYGVFTLRFIHLHREWDGRMPSYKKQHSGGVQETKAAGSVLSDSPQKTGITLRYRLYLVLIRNPEKNTDEKQTPDNIAYSHPYHVIHPQGSPSK